MIVLYLSPTFRQTTWLSLALQYFPPLHMPILVQTIITLNQLKSTSFGLLAPCSCCYHLIIHIVKKEKKLKKINLSK